MFKKICLVLLILFAGYVTVTSYLLIQWAPIGFGELEARILTVSLIGLTVGMWVYTTYELWKWKTSSILTFADVVLKILGAATTWRPKQFLYAWKAHLEHYTEYGDRSSLMNNTMLYWFLIEISLAFGLGFLPRYPFPFVGALLGLVIVIMMTAVTILAWEAWKHYFKHGTHGWKNNGTKHERPTSVA